MNISIIIPTLNRPSLSVTLAALVGQEYHEIIVVHDKHRRGVNWARNQGAFKATGDILVFIDDDTIPDQDFIEQGRMYFADNPTIGFMQGAIYGGITVSSENKMLFVGANFWIRRDTFLEIGAFSVHFVPGGQGDDLEYGFRFLDAGYKAGWNDTCKVHHPSTNQSSASVENNKLLDFLHPIRHALLIKENKVL